MRQGPDHHERQAYKSYKLAASSNQYFLCRILDLDQNPQLVGGFNLFEKYARQNGFIFPNFRGEHKKSLKPPPSPQCGLLFTL